MSLNLASQSCQGILGRWSRAKTHYQINSWNANFASDLEMTRQLQTDCIFMPWRTEDYKGVLFVLSDKGAAGTFSKNRTDWSVHFISVDKGPSLWLVHSPTLTQEVNLGGYSRKNTSVLLGRWIFYKSPCVDWNVLCTLLDQQNGKQE